MKAKFYQPQTTWCRYGLAALVEVEGGADVRSIGTGNGPYGRDQRPPKGYSPEELEALAIEAQGEGWKVGPGRKMNTSTPNRIDVKLPPRASHDSSPG